MIENFQQLVFSFLKPHRTAIEKALNRKTVITVTVSSSPTEEMVYRASIQTLNEGIFDHTFNADLDVREQEAKKYKTSWRLSEDSISNYRVLKEGHEGHILVALGDLVQWLMEAESIAETSDVSWDHD